MIIENWSVHEDRLDCSPHARTLLSLSNGYLGLRGTAEEDSDLGDQAFVNGFHETWPIVYPEDAHGMARVGQTIQPVANPAGFRLAVNGEAVNIDSNRVRDWDRRLDFRTGLLTRSFSWSGTQGAIIAVESSRMVSFIHRGLVAMTYRVTASQPCEVTLASILSLPGSPAEQSGLDPRRGTRLENPVHVVSTACVSRLAANIRTTRAGQCLSTVVSHRVDTDADHAEHTGQTDKGPSRSVVARLATGQSLTVVALACTATSEAQAHACLDGLNGVSWQSLADEQEDYLTRWWRTADVEVDAPGHIQGMIRWNLFQALQASARADGLSIAAKGVSGAGYDGHYFWDCEAMTLPYLTHADPLLARNALSFRHATLPQARHRAEELHLRGAAFPWRTINGEEASAFFEAGTAQFHINADIAYAVNRYLLATRDHEWLATEGVDLLVETARLWMSLGFVGRDGRFHIHGVTGPDEYSAMVDDNLYTNIMAATNLEAADYWLDELAVHDDGAYGLAKARLQFSDTERDSWRDAAARVAVPFDEELGVHGQDADFLNHEMWDFDGTPQENYPLLLHYHPLTIYRHQVLKQADVALALINRPDLFTPAQKRADFDYYDPITTGDSTLSAPGQATLAVEVGHLDLAERYFHTALTTDLHDSHGNTADGVHVASAAAIWSTLVMGFGGMRDHRHLSLEPRLPTTWSRLAFTTRTQGSAIRAVVTHQAVTLCLVDPKPGDEVQVRVHGQDQVLSASQPSVRVPL